MPLRIEAYAEGRGIWIKVGEIGPDDPAGTLSNTLPDRTREIYRFFCAPDGMQSEVQRLPFGVDVEVGALRVLEADDVEEAEVVARLKAGDDPYRLMVKTDVSSQRRLLRFTHIT